MIADRCSTGIPVHNVENVNEALGLLSMIVQIAAVYFKFEVCVDVKPWLFIYWPAYH